MRHAGALVIVALVLALGLLAGCAPEGGGARVSSSRIADAARLSIPTSIAAGRSMALPVDGEGRVPGVPPEAPKTADVMRPGKATVMTPEVLAVLPESVEGTMLATVQEFRPGARSIIVRVRRFDATLSLGSTQLPARLYLPAGSLVRIELPDTAAGDTPVVVALLEEGRPAVLGVRFGRTPTGPTVLLTGVARR